MFKRLSGLLITAGFLGSTPLAAQAPAEPAAATEPTVDSPIHLPALLWNDGLAMASAPWRWASEDWTRLAIGSAAVLGTAVLLDRPVHKAIVRNGSAGLTRWANNLEPLGGKYAFGTAAGFYLFGLAAKDSEARAAGADALAAMAIAAVVITPLKYGVGRARPDQELGFNAFKTGNKQDSFPSGHTTFAFTAAAAITEHYPDTWVQLTAYGLATLTGLARLEQNQHWASDVVAGALIGTAIGKGVTRFNQRLRFGRQAQFRVRLEPDFGLGYQGLRVGLAF